MITGWGYTDETKKLLPRPLTSDVLREANVYILPQDLCIKYSPFPITDKELKTNNISILISECLQMICTFKGPLGVETTCQGDSGGPLVVNSADNKWTVVGATSFGVSTCEGPYPSMFARWDNGTESPLDHHQSLPVFYNSESRSSWTLYMPAWLKVHLKC